MAVRTSRAARADLEQIWLQGATTYGVSHAQRVLRRFDELFSLLDDFPGIGLTYPEFPPDIRYFPVRNYPFLIFFTRIRGGIRIVRILPDRANIPKRF
ncbi:type II toxin-antitoxin system RelE/ParE family toxin [Jiella avicenniae]|uniref:Type II toxin-antitoxin system RelE/ParE family toxin n=1 Tax=Jiella avicenniae TaxID=2907202 RepID=A0A9X1TCE6_9HYPH|nr:type II toxin-antitoxin system RelE/ParE family toxin [Jiella avicenniae]MCE7028978.1 type II toxin-antitoxin system RelE/ParE family toxin [Jiella avicenniae]